MNTSTDAKLLQLIADLPALVLNPAAMAYQAAVRQHAFRETQLADLIKREPGSPIIPKLKEIQVLQQESLDRGLTELDQVIAILKATETRLRKIGASLPPPSLNIVD